MREFPESAQRRPDEVSRREFLRLVAATAALAGAAGCSMRPPDDPILPYVRSNTYAPGTSRHYATAMTLDGDATGLLVESHDGRPTKVEGNPAHPASLGAAGMFEQASLLQLYDPDRASAARMGVVAASWAGFAAAFAPGRMTQLAGSDGAGLRLLLEPTASPSVAALLTRLRTRYPRARVYFYSPVSRDPLYRGMHLAFGRALQPQFAVDRADTLVAIDADFLASGPFTLRYARQWADRRRLRGGSSSMSRLYVAESMLSVTGAAADARAAVRPGELLALADALLAAIDGRDIRGRLSQDAAAWVAHAARDLTRTRGRSLVIAGERQTPLVHALAAAANARLGNFGQTVTFTEPTWVDAGEPSHDLGAFVDDLRSGDVRVLLTLEANPVYSAPEAMNVAEALARVPHVVHFGGYEDETARRAEWMLPASHFLESWGDARAYDGTASIVQPIIAPLHGGHTVAEVLAMLDGDASAQAYRLTREHWTAGRADADAWWADALRRGVIADTALPAIAPPAMPDVTALQRMVADLPDRQTGLELVCPTSTVYDGRFANNPWLQELPDPISKLTWGNAACMSAATAAQLHVASGDVLALEADGRHASAPVIVIEGIAPDTIVLPLGYGRTAGGRVAESVGERAARLLAEAGSDWIGGVRAHPVTVAGQHGPEPARRGLPLAQEQGQMQGRPIALAATLDEYLRKPDIAGQRRELPTLYRPYPLNEGPQWGMAIDLSVCTGCSACVVACQAENNIPVVGAAGVLEHRHMQWLRIDRYFTTQPGTRPGVIMQPMLCQQCEMAPCEYVCPVVATTHSPDGLNEMVYNRCVGTRFCSNNCPYKVRKFNWFDYNAGVPEIRQMAMNPEVTVRERGVMEKCTFCVQRIRGAQIAAGAEGRALRHDEIVTACQQTCPTRAIVFGPINDPQAEVASLHRERRAYEVLHDLGTRPRIRYLPKITNPPTGEVRS